MDFPRVSVVIPYFNNARTLRRCLLSFAHEQTVAPYEIIVVDDGSESPACAITDTLSLEVPLRVLTVAHRGQSAASNVGIRAAQGDVVLLTCADIVAVPAMIETHAREHAMAQARDKPICVLGHIAYAPWLPTTPFLQYLSCDGPQFCFGQIEDPDNVTGAFLYSPNCSVGRDALLAVGGYDEGLPYGFQDTDLGLRLNARGIRVVYRRAAWAHHDHPNSLRNYCRRNRAIGAYVARMARRYPYLFRTHNIYQTIHIVADKPHLPDALMTGADQYEALLKGRGLRSEHERQQLFALYAQATEVAFVVGILEAKDSVAPQLGLDAASWRRLQQRAASASIAQASV